MHYKEFNEENSSKKANAGRHSAGHFKQFCTWELQFFVQVKQRQISPLSPIFTNIDDNVLGFGFV
jgi:hypothetical protein